MDLADLPQAGVRASHELKSVLDPLRRDYAWDARVHNILTHQPLAPIQDVEARMFKEILGQEFDPNTPVKVEVLEPQEWLRRVEAEVGFG